MRGAFAGRAWRSIVAFETGRSNSSNIAGSRLIQIARRLRGNHGKKLASPKPIAIPQHASPRIKNNIEIFILQLSQFLKLAQPKRPLSSKKNIQLILINHPLSRRTSMKLVVIPFACALVLSGCAAVTASQEPAGQQQIAERAAPIAAGIVRVCLGSGLFKLASGFALAAVPGGALPKAALDAGVDRVCADPERFAHDASTIEWVVKNVRAR